jgi:hypothetical protein
MADIIIESGKAGSPLIVSGTVRNYRFVHPSTENASSYVQLSDNFLSNIEDSISISSKARELNFQSGQKLPGPDLHLLNQNQPKSDFSTNDLLKKYQEASHLKLAYEPFDITIDRITISQEASTLSRS